MGSVNSKILYEYNVIGGFIGLGEYIHLEMINEMEDFPDIQ